MTEKKLPNVTIKKKVMNEGDGLGEYTIFSLYESTTDANEVIMTTFLGDFNETQMREQISNFTRQKDYWEYILTEATKL